ncbi:2-oxo acid dehydrogenase subunit E2 [Rhodococcus qingshengii]|uniref:2-oxo acid dehydrogenase subunit E2 n=1 Tax=Rhodococcus qingshengii TaxID=334542 RepID=UPI0028F3654E|nr:2-oxo acid dehydrogenase subunit E2 [Rhodococcus qingshengii]MDT9663559.1 2-oxo acid dehydrogenase subunit E2 [Rhodococcus qingshengii]
MADIKAIDIPKWGLSMEEGLVNAWLIGEGDSFTKGQLICEIETSKITNELEAPFDGVLRKIVGTPGQTLPVGAVIGVSADASATDAEIEQFLAARGATAPAEEPAPSPAAAPAAPVTPAATPAAKVVVAAKPAPTGSTVVPSVLQGTTQSDVFASPRALRRAESLGIDLAAVVGTGPLGRISVRDIDDAIRDAGGTVAPVVPAARSGLPLRSTADDSAVPATPVARRTARSLGVNLHDCRPTGSRGRVCVADVHDAARSAQLLPEAAAETGTIAVEPEYDTIPLTPMRSAIAGRLQASKQQAPHFRLTADLELDALLALRKEINSTVPAVKLSVNDFIVKACAAALMKVPDVNVQFDAANDSVLRFASADVSVAVALPTGLITPIVRSANTKSLADISGEVLSLATKAKTGKLRPEEFQGGTFTVSNLGMFGIKAFDAIINPPQGAILAVGAGEKRAVVVGDSVSARTVMTVTLSCDHRVIDGALGATFLRELQRFVASPALMLV